MKQLILTIFIVCAGICPGNGGAPAKEGMLGKEEFSRLFKGKIAAANGSLRDVTLEYDFTDTAQLKALPLAKNDL